MDWLTGLIRSGLPSEGEIYTGDVSGEIAEVIREAIGKEGKQLIREINKNRYMDPSIQFGRRAGVESLLKRLL